MPLVLKRLSSALSCAPHFCLTPARSHFDLPIAAVRAVTDDEVIPQLIEPAIGDAICQ